MVCKEFEFSRNGITPTNIVQLTRSNYTSYRYISIFDQSGIFITKNFK